MGLLLGWNKPLIRSPWILTSCPGHPSEVNWMEKNPNHLMMLKVENDSQQKWPKCEVRELSYTHINPIAPFVSEGFGHEVPGVSFVWWIFRNVYIFERLMIFMHLIMKHCCLIVTSVSQCFWCCMWSQGKTNYGHVVTGLSPTPLLGGSSDLVGG